MSRLLYVAYLDEVLSDLYCVEGSTLTDLVACEPESDAVIVSEVLTHAAYVYVVLTSALERHWVNVVLWVVDEGYALSILECLTHLSNGERSLCLHPNRL